EHYAMNAVPGMELYQARRLGAQGDFDGAVVRARSGLDDVFRTCDFFNADAGTSTLVEALLARCTNDDLAEAEAAIERLAALRSGTAWATRDCYVLRLRTLLAQARGDDAAYRELRDRYRAMANELGFEGHMKWATEMP
ncbi:MAG: hypothetical protein QOC76_3262, partial [Mycobacterium sp.]|nr:hypothetical protein [Mycobacterium sp.]